MSECFEWQTWFRSAALEGTAECGPGGSRELGWNGQENKKLLLLLPLCAVSNGLLIGIKNTS